MDENIWWVVVGKAINHIGTCLPSLSEETKHFFHVHLKKKSTQYVNVSFQLVLFSLFGFVQRTDACYGRVL